MKLNVEPCTVVKERTVKEWFVKLDDECNELKEAVLRMRNLRDDIRLLDITNDEIYSPFVVEEACDVITVVASMLTAMGVTPEEIKESMDKVNRHNIERGRMG